MVIGLIITLIGMLYSILSFISDKFIMGTVLGIVMIIGLFYFAYQFGDDEDEKNTKNNSSW